MAYNHEAEEAYRAVNRIETEIGEIANGLIAASEDERRAGAMLDEAGKRSVELMTLADQQLHALSAKSKPDGKRDRAVSRGLAAEERAVVVAEFTRERQGLPEEVHTVVDQLL